MLHPRRVEHSPVLPCPHEAMSIAILPQCWMDSVQYSVPRYPTYPSPGSACPGYPYWINQVLGSSAAQHETDGPRSGVPIGTPCRASSEISCRLQFQASHLTRFIIFNKSCVGLRLCSVQVSDGRKCYNYWLLVLQRSITRYNYKQRQPTTMTPTPIARILRGHRAVLSHRPC